MKYRIRKSTQFKKDFKVIQKREKEYKKLFEVIMLLANGEPLPEKYKDHPLWNTKHYKDCRELHIEPDWLLIYKYSNKNLILYLVRTGSHSDLLK